MADRYRRLLAETDERTGESNEERIARVYIAQAKQGKLASWEHILERVEGKVPDTVNQHVTGAVTLVPWAAKAAPPPEEP